MGRMPDASLAELYEQHAPAARRAALRLAPPGEADDLVAESFTRIIGAMASGRAAPEQFRPYLLATVRNEAYRKGTQRARLVPVPDPEPAPAPAADTAVLDADEAGRVRAAFTGLQPRWRDVLWATEVEDLGPSKLAARFGTTPDGVAQLAARAREGLRQAYLAAHAPCKAYAGLLAASARGTLGPRRAVRLDAHLASCGRCRVAAGELASINSRLGVLIGPAALALAATAAKAARRGLPWLHPAAWTAAAVTVVSAGVLPLTLTSPPHGGGGAPGTGGAAAGPVAARPAAAAAPAAYQARHARPGGPGGAAPAPAAAPVTAGHAAGGLTSGTAGTAGQAVSGVTGTAGQAVAGAGSQAGQAVTGITGAAGQAVGQVAPAAGQLVTGAGQAAGGAVSGLSGTAGQAASQAGQQVAGTVQGVLGGL